MKKQYTILIMLIVFLSLNAQALFEVKDSSDNTVLEVATDGLRIFNMGDTLMVISSSEIKAFIDENAKDRALSRSFSITTSTSAEKGVGDVVNIASDGLRVYSENRNLMDITKDNITAYIDTSFSFNVTSSNTGKLDTDVLEVSTSATKMREGDAGKHYTDFSPENIFLGLNAGLITVSELDIYEQIYDGSYNVFVGNNAGVSNTSGWSNVFIGNEAGHDGTDAYRNTYIGSKSGYNSNGVNNTFVGFSSGYENILGDENSFVGDGAGYYNEEGSSNSYFGAWAGLNNTGNQNTIIGNRAGRGLAGSAGYDNNCFFGYYSGGLHQSGNNNVMIGNHSGYMNYTGTGNVFLGYQSGFNEAGSNRLYIDNSSTSDPLIFGDFYYNRVVINGNSADNPSNYTFYVNGRGGGDYVWNSLSDKRLKKNIMTIDSPLDIVTNLRGVFYEWKDPKTQEKGRRIGFIAQEASKVLPEVVDNTGEYFSMQYAPITALLVEAVKDQQIAIEENQKLKMEIDRLNKRLNKIEKLLEKVE